MHGHTSTTSAGGGRAQLAPAWERRRRAGRVGPPAVEAAPGPGRGQGRVQGRGRGRGRANPGATPAAAQAAAQRHHARGDERRRGGPRRRLRRREQRRRHHGRGALLSVPWSRHRRRAWGSCYKVLRGRRTCADRRKCRHPRTIEGRTSPAVSANTALLIMLGMRRRRHAHEPPGGLRPVARPAVSGPRWRRGARDAPIGLRPDEWPHGSGRVDPDPMGASI